MADAASSLSDAVHGPQMAARGLGVDVASGAFRRMVHARDGSSVALESSSVDVLVDYQRGVMTGSPWPPAPTPKPGQGGCLVRPPQKGSRPTE